MSSSYLNPESIKTNKLKERYRLRCKLCDDLDKWTSQLQKRNVSGAEIMSNLLRYCHIYASRCTDLPEDEEKVKDDVFSFIENVGKKYPFGTGNRVKLVEMMIYAAYWLIDPQLNDVTDAGKVS